MRLKTIPQAVTKLHEDDPGTALNRSMLLTLMNEGLLDYEMRGNRRVIDYDDLCVRLRELLGLTEGHGYLSPLPHIRSVNGAYRELKETRPELGLSEERIRMLIDTGRLVCIPIGNRSYIALELFKPPYDQRLMLTDGAEHRPAKRKYFSPADEQIREVLAKCGRGVRMKRSS